MSSGQKSSRKNKNWCEISMNLYLDLKFGTSKVFETGKLILDSDFENFQIGVSYNAMSSGVYDTILAICSNVKSSFYYI